MVYCNGKHDYTSVIDIFWGMLFKQYSSLIMNSFRFSGVSIPRVPTLGYMGNNRSVFLDGQLTWVSFPRVHTQSIDQGTGIIL